MRTWKELGEVPDSDDEEFDNQSRPGSPIGPFGLLLPRPTSPPSRSHDDIWSVPSSQLHDNTEQHVQQYPLPLTTNATGTATRRPNTSSQSVGVADALSEHSSPLSTPSSSALALPSPTEPRRADSPTPESSSLNFVGPEEVSRHIRREPLASPIQPLIDSADISSTQAAIRLERSLRPRKPIQEHPYLLENARYNKVMKSHGVKPIRVVTEDEAAHRRRKGEDDSQDQEFSAEDSQMVSENLPGLSGESQPVNLDFRSSLGDSRDELALSPSPSPKPSSQTRWTRPSSQISQICQEEHTDNTSLLGDDDLPSLDELIRHSWRRGRREPKRSSESTITSSVKRRKTAHQRSPTSTTTSRFKPVDIYDLASSPPPTVCAPAVQNPRPPPRQDASPPRQFPRMEVVINLVDYGCNDESDDSNDGLNSDLAASGSPTSESESEAVRRNVRRIRGVLPASWLRLDQLNGPRMHKRGESRQSPPPSPQVLPPMRGVALPKQSTTLAVTQASALLDFFSDDNDNDNDNDGEDEDEDEGENEGENEGGDDGNKIESVGAVSAPMASGSFSVGSTMKDGHAGSAGEEDNVDMMLPASVRGRRRNMAPVGNLRPAETQGRRAGSAFQRLGSRAGTIRSSRQPKITASFHRQAQPHDQRAGRPDHTSTRPRTGGGNLGRVNKASARAFRHAKSVRPPSLSILDRVEPDAPAFIKIAARTAKRTRNQGKSSPSRKHINLGNRADNIDALSVLQDWKAGKIQPRPSKVTSQQKAASPAQAQTQGHAQPCAREPLSHRSVNVPTTPYSPIPRPKIDSGRPLRTTRQPRSYRSPPVLQTVAQESGGSRRSIRSITKTRNGRPQQVQGLTQVSRPAQLETSELERRPGKVAFLARKKRLDALYRRDKSLSGHSAVRLGQFLDSRETEEGIAALDHGEESQPAASTGIDGSTGRPEETRSGPSGQSTAQRMKYRKCHAPRFVDVMAARFLHAMDPLPPGSAASEATEAMEAVGVVGGVDIPSKGPSGPHLEGKLGSLGPFGTHYTHHFEVFPLDSGVFFHESSFIGRGRLIRALDVEFLEKIWHARTRISFRLGDEMLRWGSWDDTVSSELGILVDSMLDQLSLLQGASGETETGTGAATVAVAAADFLVDYMQDSVSFSGPDSMESFVCRLCNLLRGAAGRVEATVAALEVKGGATSPRRWRLLHRLLPRILVVAFLSLRLSRSSPALMQQSLQMEQALTRLAKGACRSLVERGLGEVEKTYEDMQQLSLRERGIKENRETVVLWVVLMQTLDAAKIPRTSFWDIVQSVTITPTELAACYDAQRLERAWKVLFTLLPLVEFDGSGILVAGSRHGKASEGWAFAQALVKRVFQLYQKKPRQAASFNDYCRALLGRCHYLMEQWGWRRKCSGLVGTVFDFFGAQDLAHLRNEEVYKSPRFLEQLSLSAGQSSGPSLGISPEDRCFHVFVKMIGLAIQKLRGLGLVKDIKNLVARTLPNHNRQYLKEQAIRQHELAALRNHHDLLCTLFWACPQDLRPPVHLVEKLVVPGSSHKEACLINIRAWSQLARFVVASGEGAASFRTFISWQNNVFRQTLEQYLSAASDIHQQLSALSGQGSGGGSCGTSGRGSGRQNPIGQDMVEVMISKNKAAAMDVLYCSVQASLDVLKVAPSLDAATYSLNVYQLVQVFTRFDLSSDGFDCGILLVAIETVEQYLNRLDSALDHQYSSDSSGGTRPGSGNPDPDPGSDSDQTEEATLMLDHQLAEGLFSVTSGILDRIEAKGLLSPLGSSRERLCAEKAVLVSSRLANRFVQDGIARLSRFFSPGKYCVFNKPPQRMSLVRRRYLALFVATLVKNSMFDLKDLGTSVFEVWMLSVSSPVSTLEFVSHLGETLQLHNFPFVCGAVIPPGIGSLGRSGSANCSLDYDLTRDLFACGIASMRRSLREASGSQRPQIRAEHTRVLRSVMNQVKADLASLKQQQQQQQHHLRFVDFVRQVVALMKSHGGDICPVDQYFYQVSPEYSPSVQDPQLHLAGIVAYGIRFGEGESTAVPKLFYYLYNNFKLAVVNGRLGGEVNIVERSMENPDILAFMLGRMLPALVRAAAQEARAWPMLEVYCRGLQRLLGRSCLPLEMGDERTDDLTALVLAVLSGIKKIRAQACNGDGAGMSLMQLYVLVQLAALANTLGPCLTASSLVLLLDGSARGANTITKATEAFSSFCGSAALALSNSGVARGGCAYCGNSAACCGNCAGALLEGIRDFDPVGGGGEGEGEGFGGLGLDRNPHVESFSRHMVTDIGKSWVVTDRNIVVAAPGKGVGGTQNGTQTGGGMRGSESGSGYDPWTARDLMGRLQDQVHLWLSRSSPPNRRQARRQRMRWQQSLEPN